MSPAPTFGKHLSPGHDPTFVHTMDIRLRRVTVADEKKFARFQACKSLRSLRGLCEVKIYLDLIRETSSRATLYLNTFRLQSNDLRRSRQCRPIIVAEAHRR